MAAWQYDIRILPRTRLHAILGDVPLHIDRETLESVNWWQGVATPDFEAAFGALDRASSWDPEVETWGKEDSDRVDVRSVGGVVSEVFARIDVRSLPDGLLPRLLTFAEEIEGVLVTTGGRVMPPDVDLVWSDLRLSGAANFVRDPEGFLRSLKSKKAPK